MEGGHGTADSTVAGGRRWRVVTGGRKNEGGRVVGGA